ncbi:sigma-70 family RNA polymerase sigma factor [Streptomyces sp. So13.3]|uniref:RNA polymerase subunit sigma-70 n=1 Tax=Streptomyces sp. So13.3 TaxID=2136173 RepID=UPI001106AA49|nr:RNA polymerase subunit sigma-70 [Streptomyces sp. So13.3]QNA71341.1 sigma-70 family RNA polymerase sigma factor [Streptomyces sp. So13.3]
MTGKCQICGAPIEAGGRSGRAAVYCSQACRQRAYRERRQPAGVPAGELVTDIGDRVRRLRLAPALAFHADVESLSARFAQLRRLARQAREEFSTPAPATPAPTPPAPTTPAPATPAPATPAPTTPATSATAAENVTPGRVTILDEEGFATLTEEHRRELRVHCYRLLGSYDEAEDLTQEAFLRAWRARETLADVGNPRAWLYRIATNACLDFLRKHNRRPTTYEPVPGMDSGDGPPPPRLPWLQPFPDDQLPETPAPQHEPDEQAVASETLELVFLTAIQQLPPRQRAAVILRDIAGWSAQETADLLGGSLASANSAVQRGRSALREALPGRREDWTAAEPSAEDMALLQGYMEAAARCDIDAMTELVRADAVLTMPPNPFWFTTREALFAFVRPNLDPASPMFAGYWRHLPVHANGQLAVAGYLQRPGTSVFRAQLIDVLRVEEGRIAEITTFEPHLFTAFGLPMTL